MNKKDLLKLLRTNNKVYIYVAWNSDCGGYVQLVKSDFMTLMKEHADDMIYNVDVTVGGIYIN